MFAFLAVVAFALALAFHVIGHGTASLVTDFVIGGLLCLALHFALGDRVPGWVRR